MKNYLLILLAFISLVLISVPSVHAESFSPLFYCIGDNGGSCITRTPSAAVPQTNASVSPSPSTSPSVNSPSPVTGNGSPSPSASQSSPSPSVNPCVTKSSTGDVQAFKHRPSLSRGGVQQFIQLLLQLLQLLFQLLGGQIPTPTPTPTPTPSAGPSSSPSGQPSVSPNPCPSASPSTAPSNTPSTPPSPTVFGTSPSPSSGAPSPSNGAGNGNGNNPSPSSGSGNNNNPSPSSGSGNNNGGGTQKDSFSAPKVTEKTTLSGTTWVMTVTWPPVTTTTQGNKASPTAYNFSFNDSSGKTIHGMTNTSTHPVSDGKTDYCTSTTCTQTVTATSTKNSANTNGSDPITLLSSGKATVLVSAAATSTILASANGTYTVGKPTTTAACKSPAPDVVGEVYTTAESNLTAANYKYTLTNGKAGNIISETAAPGTTSCSVTIETDNIATPTTKCTTSATQTTRCIDGASAMCSSLTITGHAGAYCETDTVHHNGTGGYYSTGYCPGGTNFKCWVPGATSAKTGGGGNGGTTSCSSLKGTCSVANTAGSRGGTEITGGDAECKADFGASYLCYGATAPATAACTNAGYSCFNSSSAATAVPVSKGIVTHSTGAAKYDTSCGSGKSCYEIMTCGSAGYQCLTQATITSLKGKITVTHSTAAAKYDKYCAAQGLSYTGCYEETTVKTASVPNSAVAASTVNQTATAAPSLWTTITSSILHVLTSL